MIHRLKSSLDGNTRQKHKLREQYCGPEVLIQAWLSRMKSLKRDIIIKKFGSRGRVLGLCSQESKEQQQGPGEMEKLGYASMPSVSSQR